MVLKPIIVITQTKKNH